MNSHGARRRPGSGEPTIRFVFDGEPVVGLESDTVASALLAAGHRIFTYAADGSPRGGYCFVGRCGDCLMLIDGQPGLMACQTAVRAGMVVETQQGRGHWAVEAAL